MVVVAALAVTAAGIGGAVAGATSSSADGHVAATATAPRTPEKSLQQMLRALGTGDVDAACVVAAPDGFPVRRDADRRACVRALRAQLQRLEPEVLQRYRQVVVRGAAIESGTATVLPSQISRAPVEMRNASFSLIQSGGRWFVVV